MTDTVAVVITFYRNDRFFPEALASVLAQSRRPDEIVVVDDGSPPGTATTLVDLEPNIKLVRLDINRGPGAARQSGAAATTSDLICYLDADDTWLPNKLERQLADFAACTNAAAHHVGLTTFTADNAEKTHVHKPALLDLASQLRRNQPLPSAYLIRRTALESIGGWTDDRTLVEDWDLNIRLVAAGHAVRFLAEPLVRFRRTGHGNLSSRGMRHMWGNLNTITEHFSLYRRTLGLAGTMAVAGRVLHDEGCRRGGLSGWPLRVSGRAMRLGK
jgi:glycosyltransferase involved in cell wall biosynthesis